MPDQQTRSVTTRVFSGAKKMWAAALTFIVAWAGAVGVLDPLTGAVSFDVDLTLGQAIAGVVGLLINAGGVYAARNNTPEPTQETTDENDPS